MEKLKEAGHNSDTLAILEVVAAIGVTPKNIENVAKAFSLGTLTPNTTINGVTVAERVENTEDHQNKWLTPGNSEGFQ